MRGWRAPTSGGANEKLIISAAACLCAATEGGQQELPGTRVLRVHQM
jgi:hypothetical protein